MNDVLLQRQVDWTTTTPTTAITTAIATIEDVDPVALPAESETTLYDAIDPGALETLVTDETDVTVTFVLGDHRVRIDGPVLTIGRD